MGSRKNLSLPTLTITAGIALLAFSSPALAETYGANLAHPANGIATCSQPYLISALPNPFTLPYDSCTAFSSTSTNDPFHPEGTVSPPNGHGIITRVRVKVGAQTAPMRIIILRALRQEGGGEAACCTGRSRSEIFTPAPNAITEVNTNLPVVSEFDLNSRFWNFDIVALSVFASNVPLPAYDSGNASDTCSSIYAPSIDSNEERNVATNNGACGYTVLISVDWARQADGGGGGGGGGGGNENPPQRAVELKNANAKLRRGAAPLVLDCLLDTICRGMLTLGARGANAAGRGAGGDARAAAGKKKRSYGSARFSIAAKQSKTVKVKLNRAGKKLLRKRRSAKVAASVTVESGSSPITQSFEVKLRR